MHTMLLLVYNAVIILLVHNGKLYPQRLGKASILLIMGSQ